VQFDIVVNGALVYISKVDGFFQGIVSGCNIFKLK
jgi:hypothetical protein